MASEQPPKSPKTDDFPKMAELLGAMLGILAPLTQDQRVRLVKSVVAFHDLPIGKAPNQHRGDHECG